MSNETKVEVLKALADPTRLSILGKIASDGAPVLTCDLVGGCGSVLKLSQPTMSHHINKLVQAGLLIEQKQAKQKSYSLNTSLIEELGIDMKVLTR